MTVGYSLRACAFYGITADIVLTLLFDGSKPYHSVRCGIEGCNRSGEGRLVARVFISAGDRSVSHNSPVRGAFPLNVCVAGGGKTRVIGNAVGAPAPHNVRHSRAIEDIIPYIGVAYVVDISVLGCRDIGDSVAAVGAVVTTPAVARVSENVIFNIDIIHRIAAVSVHKELNIICAVLNYITAEIDIRERNSRAGAVGLECNARIKTIVNKAVTYSAVTKAVTELNAVAYAVRAFACELNAAADIGDFAFSYPEVASAADTLDTVVSAILNGDIAEHRNIRFCSTGAVVTLNNSMPRGDLDPREACCRIGG